MARLRQMTTNVIMVRSCCELMGPSFSAVTGVFGSAAVTGVFGSAVFLMHFLRQHI